MLYFGLAIGLSAGSVIGLVVFSLLKAAAMETPVPYVRQLPETDQQEPPKNVPRPVDAEAIEEVNE